MTARIDFALVERLWSEFAAGGVAVCPEDGQSTLGIAVTEGPPITYQMRCACCMWQSDWFITDAGRIRLLGSLETLPPRAERRR